jgi:hypothetical protein
MELTRKHEEQGKDAQTCSRQISIVMYTPLQVYTTTRRNHHKCSTLAHAQQLHGAGGAHDAFKVATTSLILCTPALNKHWGLMQLSKLV